MSKLGTGHTPDGEPVLNDGSVVDRYYRGEIEPSEMSNEAYFGLHLIKSCWGANVDFMAYARGDVDQARDRLKTLLLFTYKYGYDGAERGISIVDYFGRFKHFNLSEYGQQYNSGLNFLVVPVDHDDDPWRRTNWRKQQVAEVVPGGEIKVPLPDKELLNQPIEFVNPPDNLAETMLHVARGIRTVALQSPEPKVGGSFRDALKSFEPGDVDELRFEDLVGIASNLAVALGILLEQFSDPKEKKNYIGDVTASLEGDERIGKVREYFEKAHSELFGDDLPPADSSLRLGTEQLNLLSMGDMAPFVMLFLPVEIGRVNDYIPESEHRETIEFERAGGNDMTEAEEQARAVVQLLGELIEEEEQGEGRQEMITDLEESIGLVKRAFGLGE